MLGLVRGKLPGRLVRLGRSGLNRNERAVGRGIFGVSKVSRLWRCNPHNPDWASARTREGEEGTTPTPASPDQPSPIICFISFPALYYSTVTLAVFGGPAHCNFLKPTFSAGFEGFPAHCNFGPAHCNFFERK